MNDFLPQEYEAPKSSSRYFKPKNGDNKVRILGKPLLGWVDWTNDKKPVRTVYQGMSSQPKPINPKRPAKHFWAMPVWDYTEKTIKIWEITQSTIQNALYTLAMDEAWGDPKSYDLNVKKSGEDLETKYEVVPRPPVALSDEIVKASEEIKVNLNALLTNDDPFSNSTETERVEIETSLEDIPF